MKLQVEISRGGNMKSHLLAGASALIFSTLASSAYAADVQAAEVMPAQNLWYVSLFGGASFPQDVKTDYFDGQFDLDLDTGFVIGATVGRRINDTFRVEGELSYARYKAGSATYSWGGYVYAPDPASGDLSATYLLANVWADLAHFGQATVYAGGGIGAAYVTADTQFDGRPFGYGKGEWGFAGQLGAGVTYAVAQNIDLDFGYRFKAVSDIDFNDNFGGDPYTGGNLYSHNLQLGITAKF
ncbi:outer membrane protein [Mesorhizobium sp. ANAO-SY3R2]|uniref:outer membrane protein n=1 Tax=Mesorhizobium sp. ANAO-SY3R2 TaxID=3166644 RepID=UPI00366B9E15